MFRSKSGPGSEAEPDFLRFSAPCHGARWKALRTTCWTSRSACAPLASKGSHSARGAPSAALVGGAPFAAGRPVLGSAGARWRARRSAIGAPRLEKYLPGYLDRAQIDALFQMVETRAASGRFVDVRNAAILELFYSTGMRLSELQGEVACDGEHTAREAAELRTRLDNTVAGLEDMQNSLQRVTARSADIGELKKNHHLLAEKLHDLIALPSAERSELGAAARRVAEQRWSWKSVSDGLLAPFMA